MSRTSPWASAPIFTKSAITAPWHHIFPWSRLACESFLCRTPGMATPKIDRAGPAAGPVEIMRHIPIFIYSFGKKMVFFSVFSYGVLHSFWKLEQPSDLIHAPAPRRECVEPVQCRWQVASLRLWVSVPVAGSQTLNHPYLLRLDHVFLNL